MVLSILEWKSMAWSGNELILCLTCRAGLKVDMKVVETCALVHQDFLQSGRVCETPFGLDWFGLTWEPSGSVSQTLRVLIAGQPPVESNCWSLLVIFLMNH